MEKEAVSLQDALEHGLTPEEFQKIQEILGRIPNSTELGIFSAMWSEHCSYKNSILKLKTLPTSSDKLLAQAGEENAGAMDIGDGLAVVFKIESHNHPTAVEPYQGAATGVGGIMRDIFTMGARPIVSLNSLRFGNPDEPRNKYLLSRAVKGIGDYGNSLGIAVSGGELFIDECFTKNPLVNAMTVGIVRHDQMASATTGGKVGNAVYIVGATTGRDGIHGASFASKDLSKESESKRSAVQVGDPFMEKLLMEASLEAIQKGLLVGIQDMGAAGISCATSEMSAKGKTGMKIDLDRVPFRETGMNAYEAMLSESQERMLVVPKKGKEAELVAIFEKWNLNAVQIGEITGDGMIEIRMGGQLKAKIPAESLVLGGGAPRYEREVRRPSYLDSVKNWTPAGIPDVAETETSPILLRLLSSWNVCSRKPITEQYDTEVGLVKLIGPGCDGGLSSIPDTNKALATATDCNSRYTYLDPYKGAEFAVCESARNVYVTGATPLGVTNNLNFANPYIPENYYMFSECVRGLGDACRALDLPVTGGNVSFYNESPEGPIFPTPTIGMVGILQDKTKLLSNVPEEAGLHLAILGNFRPSLGGSEYLKTIHGQVNGAIPELDIKEEAALCRLIISLNEKGVLKSAKDLSLGGLGIALAKTVLLSGLGIEADLTPLKTDRNDLTLFGESAASVLASFTEKDAEEVRKSAEEAGLHFYLLGKTNATGILNVAGFGVRVTLEEMSCPYESGLESVFAL
ncbi:phosphoribosylformylglycinamidine synthase subunit PurL [Leptospira gomenensis]|uniref:Phosphoribosylformylglycinamidine synthase subunit PurL n=1 Tax=Leptospira gomenensis TaxID=2484974 RepID=A0A5F1Y6P3_9LEPT|nr:phosphoribosylformylglycinamidine synthase subunit PurL [Leptospira gomenensis]TGK28957.1 phosphoribosylformylglycinamidine synthase subunit PurL [Leptospira gomenensis]TGK35418.1 phosphoribosylformylglycinamidine synthase subunit PurL [Leptospira gomenensis]TGK40716.1 phosphoribosylformylglycinamidine synthase subunit PurL [Leptospira gomenensis]TGK68440.1 phosphoribosylformylglycinamidine synthase subunit PurL [Leptospira gomenensis]